MKKMRIYFILLLLSCHSNELKNDDANSVLSLSKNDLDALKYITVHIRNNEKPVKFLYSTEQEDLLLPIASYFDSTLQNYFRTDINKFCSYKNITKSDCDSFLWSHTEHIKDILRRIYVSEIQSNRKLGRFIIFTLKNGNKIIYRYDTTLVHPYWRAFFDSSKSIKTNWYFKINLKSNM